MDEHRLDVAEMSFEAQFATKTWIADAAHCDLDGITQLPAGKQPCPDESFRIAIVVFERAENDLAGA
ncbi:hypothetical protein D3C87_1348740 [compost metagenome]